MADDFGGNTDRSVDLTAFIAVLVTGIVLIKAVHLSVEASCEYLLALAGLYAAWRSR
jgi:hypothetical protein